MNAEIIQFIPRPGHDHEQTDFPTIAFRSAVHEPAAYPTDLTRCEYVAADHDETP